MTKEKQQILQNILSKSEEEFVHYDVALDCINPETGQPLINASDDTLTRFYAFRNNNICYDADASLEANVIYEKVFEPIYNMIDPKVIRKQCDKDANKFNAYGLKYELGEADCTGGISFRGDTMNSVATTNRAYLKHKELHYKNTGVNFPYPEEALKLMDLYHTPGNFMILPWCAESSINCDRGTGNAKDYFDLFLMAIYNSFLVYNHKDWCNGISLAGVLKNRKTVTFMRGYLTSYLDDDEYRFGTERCQQIDDIEDGCMLIDYAGPGWESFVEKNLLQDFVEVGPRGHYGRPKEFWNGHFDDFIRSGNALPKEEERFFEFWNNSAEWIQLRSRRIYEKMEEMI